MSLLTRDYPENEEIPVSSRVQQGKESNRQISVAKQTLTHKQQPASFSNASPLPSMAEFPEIKYITGTRVTLIPGPSNRSTQYLYQSGNITYQHLQNHRRIDSTQHIEITHPNNVNLKLAFHKVASFHPHYLTFTPQTYHHPVHRFRSWPMQTTSQSHPHTQVPVQPRNTYKHTYTKFLPGQNKTTSY